MATTPEAEDRMGLPNIGPVELIIVLVIALLILGPGKLPEVGSAFGKTIKEFRKAASDIQDTTSVATKPVAEATAALNTATAPVAAAPAPAPAAPVAAAPAPVAEAPAPAPAGTPVDAVTEQA
jgi:TatA/E family protein of Tat protein translocase